MWFLTAALLAVAAGIVLAGGGSARRLAAVLPRPVSGERRAGPPPPPSSRPSIRRWYAALPAGIAVYVVVGGLGGLIAGLGCTVGVAVALGRRTPEAVRLARARIGADLPFAAELMAACLRSGSPVDTAAEVVAASVGGPLGERLSAVAGRLRLGADPRAAWTAMGDEPALEQFARTVARAAASGAPLAALLERLAADGRARFRVEAASAARRVGVYAVAPLGLCFLPAFVLLGVVPVVAGLAADLQIF